MAEEHVKKAFAIWESFGRVIQASGFIYEEVDGGKVLTL
jgi:hypothetical protein